jgi:hypothetical protein
MSSHVRLYFFIGAFVLSSYFRVIGGWLENHRISGQTIFRQYPPPTGTMPDGHPPSAFDSCEEKNIAAIISGEKISFLSTTKAEECLSILPFLLLYPYEGGFPIFMGVVEVVVP